MSTVNIIKCHGEFGKEKKKKRKTGSYYYLGRILLKPSSSPFSFSFFLVLFFLLLHPFKKKATVLAFKVKERAAIKIIEVTLKKKKKTRVSL